MDEKQNKKGKKENKKDWSKNVGRSIVPLQDRRKIINEKTGEKK
jgi:hypothetical protein